jgi:hypothetical protein
MHGWMDGPDTYIIDPANKHASGYHDPLCTVLLDGELELEAEVDLEVDLN